MSERPLSDHCPPGWHEDKSLDELVGRDGEVALLADRVAGLFSGRSAVVTVTGQPGAGRSALLRKTLLLAKNAGVRTVLLRSSRADANVPYGLANRLAETLDFRCPAGPTQCGEFLAVTRDRPTVVAVDDLQWADPLSRQWLRTAARRLHTTSLLLVCAVRGRHSTVDIDAPWVPDSVLELKPLNTDEVHDVIAAGYTGAVEDEFAACVSTATGGIPAILKAALGRFALTGLPPAAAQLPAFSLRASETVNHYLEDVLLDLPPGSMDLLRALAVTDGGLDFELVRTLAGSLSVPTPELLGPLVSAGLVEPSGPRPASPEVTGKVLAGMAAEARNDLYSRAAELGHRAAISDLPLSTLLLGAPAVGKSWAVDTLHRAATRHQVEGRASRAMALLRRALLEPVDEPRRSRLLMDLAASEVRESPDGSDRRLRRILLSPEARGDGPLLVKAADLLVARGSTSDTRRVLATVCTREGVDPSVSDTLSALGWLAHGGETDDHEFPVASAPILPPLPDIPADPTQAAVVAWQLACRGRGRSRAKALARAALDRGVDQNRPLSPRIAAAMALGYTGETAEAIAGLDGVLTDARRQNARAAAGQALLHRALLAQRDGHLTEAAEDLSSARAQLPLNCWSPSALPGFLALEVMVNVERGSLDRAQRAAAVELPPDAENGIGWARLLCARGIVELTAGSPEAALHRFQEAGRVLVSRQWMNPTLAPWRVLAAAANRRCGNENAARRLVGEEVELAWEWGSPTALGIAHLGAGNALGGTEATGYLEEAVRLLRNSPARLRYATAVIDLAAARLDTGELDEATTLLRAAEGVAQLHQADGLVRRLRELSEQLAVARCTPDPRPPFSGDSVLSGQEEHLAGLAAAGRSNTEIAASLSVSTRTVELRLAKIYRKLGVAGRTGLRSVFMSQPM